MYIYFTIEYYLTCLTFWRQVKEKKAGREDCLETGNIN